jgi:Arc/MetJ family transcription regulator
LNGLRREVRSGVLREEREIRSQEQVIAAAQRLHKLETISTGVSHALRSRVRSEGVNTQGKAESKKSTSEGRTETRKCYNCGKQGHMARVCPQADTSKK